MDKSRVLIAILLSTVILIGWPVAMRYFNMWPNPTEQAAPMPPVSTDPQAEHNAQNPPPAQMSGEPKTKADASPAKANAPATGANKSVISSATTPASVQTTTVPQKDIVITTSNWQAK